jgi:hypothetical protein
MHPLHVVPDGSERNVLGGCRENDEMVVSLIIGAPLGARRIAFGGRTYEQFVSIRPHE